MRKELEVFFISLLVIIFSLWTYRLTAADPPTGCCKDNQCDTWWWCGPGICTIYEPPEPPPGERTGIMNWYYCNGRGSGVCLCGSWGNGLCSSHPCYGDDPCLAVDCYGWKCRTGLCYCIGKD